MINVIIVIFFYIYFESTCIIKLILILYIDIYISWYYSFFKFFAKTKKEWQSFSITKSSMDIFLYFKMRIYQMILI